MRTMVLLTMLSTPARAALVGSAMRRATTRGASMSPTSLPIVDAGLHVCAGARSLCSSSSSRSSNLVMEAAAATVSGDELAALEEQIRAQGIAVRDAKEAGDEAATKAAVAELLALKAKLPADHEML